MSITSDSIEQIAARFRSGNSVPVERATVLAEEWAAAESESARLRAEAKGLSQAMTDALACEQDYLREISDLRATQPSPAGQGDALVQEALEYFERAGDAGDRKYVAAIRTALAARQPVGEPGVPNG